MKTVKQPISNASFIALMFSLTVIKPQKREAVKRAALIFFVLLCALTRYIVLSADKSLEKQSRQATVSAENLNLPVWKTDLILKRKISEKNINKPLKIYNEKFKEHKKSLSLFNVD